MNTSCATRDDSDKSLDNFNSRSYTARNLSPGVPMPCACARIDAGQSCRVPATSAHWKAFSAVLLSVLALALLSPSVSANPPPDSESSSHILVGMTPNQGFEVTCEDSVLFSVPVVADDLGIMEFRVSGRFGPPPHTICVRVPAPPQVAGEHVDGICDHSATVRWSTDRPATSQVEYGPTPSYGSASPENTSLVVDHEITLSGLSPETTYHCRVISTDAFGNTTAGPDRVFATLPPAPLLLDVRAEAVTESSFVARWTTSRPCNSTVEYGLTSDYGQQTDVSPELVTDHAVTVSGLTPHTTYHFRVVSEDEEGRTVCSEDHVVDTLLGQLLLLDVTISDTSDQAATVEWTTTNPASSWVAYGQGSEPDNVAGSDSLTLHHRVEITGLLASTTYSLIAFSVDESGASAESDELVFTTTCAPLEITTPGVAATTCTSITVSWITNAPADGSVEYGPDESYGQTAPGDTELSLGHEVTIDGLEPASVYHIRAVSTDACGFTARSEDQVVATETPELSILSVAIAETTATSVTITWTTTNASRCHVEYGPTQSYGFQTEPNPFHLCDHSVVISDLAPRALYHFRIHAVDQYDQSAVTTDSTFSTDEHDGPGGLLVYGVVAQQVSPGYALICWQTNMPASSTVHYGTTESCDMSVSDGSPVTDHCLALTDLTPGTRYYYKVSSQGAGDLTAESHLYTFVTPEVDDLAPGAPTGVTASSCEDGVRISWNAGPEYDLETYRLYRRAGVTSYYQEITEIPAGVTSHVDRDVLDGWSYEYAVSAVDADGNESDLSASVAVDAGSGESGHIWVYPNPVRRRTTISFSAPSGCRGSYSVRIYNARGRLVRTLDGGPVTDRVSSVSWNARDNGDYPVSSGTYFCVVEAGDSIVRSKIMVLR
ncbi:MAG: T9SS type A sorting domain-containing protein [Candidatus Eisenbacteria bacterium]|nr:T9SS type A sorting domain-containing protein [Candidatus Eisenbacteria bacterium]